MDVILFLPVLILSVVLHEYAHGWMAQREGDNTAAMLGRLTLNPIPHLDLFGSIIVPIILWLSPGDFMLGWAKPVPVNPRNYRNYKSGDIKVSLAGIVVNLILALIFMLAIIGIYHLGRAFPAATPTLRVAMQMAEMGMVINLVLAFFNLIPIPPLDGSHVLYHLLPPDLGMKYREVGRYGMLILIGLMFLAPGFFQVMLTPAFALMQFAREFINLWT